MGFEGPEVYADCAIGGGVGGQLRQKMGIGVWDGAWFLDHSRQGSQVSQGRTNQPTQKSKIISLPVERKTRLSGEGEWLRRTAGAGDVREAQRSSRCRYRQLIRRINLDSTFRVVILEFSPN